MKGRIEYYREEDTNNRPYGFIRGEDEASYYFNPSLFARRPAADDLRKGTQVSFVPGHGFNGKPRATEIRPDRPPKPALSPGPSANDAPRKAKAPDGAKPHGDSAPPPAESPPVPYDFLPVRLALATSDAPVWHDGSSRDEQNEDLLSGEILITLEALTPLLAANDQYEASQVKGASPVADKDHVRLSSNWTLPAPVPKEKKILEPLRLGDEERRVAIPGSALKGMLRQALSGLLSAPMERVAEHEYTYRPNLGFPKQASARLELRPAIVEAVVVYGEETRVTVRILNHAQAAVFLREGASEVIQDLGIPLGETINRFVPEIQYVQRKNKKLEWVDDRQRIRGGKTAKGLKLNHVLCHYVGGLDGTGELAGRFARTMNRKPSCPLVHHEALVPVEEYKVEEYKNGMRGVVIPEAVYRHFRKTQETLARNVEKDHPLFSRASEADRKAVEQTARAIRATQHLRAHQLIYVEVIPGDGGQPPTVVSMGHNFQYRWRHTDSVRRRGLEDAERDILKPLEIEAPGEDDTGPHAPPRALSAARLLHGYTDPAIGRGDFSRLAGRLAPNMAVEVWPDPERPDRTRFLGAAPAHVVPLKVLGSPKPSSWERYLQQPEDGLPVTWGDLPDTAGGELAGRKCYPHQPDAAHDKSVYRDPQPAGGDNKDKLGALARFISAPGVRFRFALRFARLRRWELGALLAVLEPDRMHDLWSELATPAGDPGQPAYAHKLGHGRPLGLGSVKLTVDRLRWRPESIWSLTDDADGALARNALEVFKASLGDSPELREHLAAWLNLLRYRGRTRAEYPKHALRPYKKDGTPTEPSILDWHSHVRRSYAELRRTQEAETSAQACDLLNFIHNKPRND